MSILNDTRLQDLMARVSELGKAEGKGVNAKPAYALDVIAAAHDGVIGNDHAEGVWGAFQTAVGKTKGDEKLRLSDPKTTKVRVSECRKLIAMGSIAAFDPSEVAQRAIKVINEYAGTKGSTYQNLVVVARKQIEKRAAALNDEEILAAITPQAAEEKEEKELLGALVKRMKKMHDGDEKDVTAKVYPSPELQTAIKALEGRLAQLENGEQMDKLFKLAALKGVDQASIEALIASKQ